MYTRGQFAIMGNVGRKALRLYHEEGLLVPAYTNEENGYHYYEEKQLVVLEKIKQLRKIGISLFEIKQILDGKVREEDVVGSKIKETDHLLRQMKDYDANSKMTELTPTEPIPTELMPTESMSTESTQADVQSTDSKFKTDVDIRDVIDKTNGAAQIEVTQFKCPQCLYVIENVERENLGMSVGKLYEKASREGIQIAGDHFVKYEHIDQEELFSMMTCLPVEKYTGGEKLQMNEHAREETLPMNGHISDDIMSIEEEKCLHLHFTGGFSKVWQAHKQLRQYADQNQIQLAERVYEVYRKDMTVDVYYAVVC